MDMALHLYAPLLLVSVPPMIPNSALLAGAGAFAAKGVLDLPLLVLLILAGTILGDLAVYGVGRRWSARATAWLSRSPKRRAALAWTTAHIERYGVPSVIGLRFLPGGRGMGAITSGIAGLPFRAFLLAAGVAELIFVTCTVGLGYLGGRLIPADGPVPLLIGPAVSFLVAGAAFLIARFRGRA